MTKTSCGNDLAGKAVIVTGAAGGIGRAVSEAFAACGSRMLLADVRGGDADDLAQSVAASGGDAQAVAVDVTDRSSVEDMIVTAIARLGRVDILVHCAGLGASRATVWELDDALWDRIIDLDLSSAWRCASAANTKLSPARRQHRRRQRVNRIYRDKLHRGLSSGGGDSARVAGPRSEKGVPTAEQILYVLNCMTLDTD